ncbi:hypothetical protein PSN45_003031 [Yamadazyma tenuis]|uniref:uncharacterized protein n=1 Tax=Candida tenuis TaxID=2315449 RepID=UPI0027A5F8DC|nr:hypothetical protein PSN45_003031 [Yamadazyma tenuis]
MSSELTSNISQDKNGKGQLNPGKKVKFVLPTKDSRIVEPDEYTIEELKNVFSNKRQYHWAPRNRYNTTFGARVTLENVSIGVESEKVGGPPLSESTSSDFLEPDLQNISTSSFNSLTRETNQIHTTIDDEKNKALKKKSTVFRIDLSENVKRKGSKTTVQRISSPKQNRGDNTSALIPGTCEKPTTSEDNGVITVDANTNLSKTTSAIKKHISKVSKPKPRPASKIHALQKEQSVIEKGVEANMSFKPVQIKVRIKTKTQTYFIHKYQEIAPEDRKNLTHKQLNDLFPVELPF